MMCEYEYESQVKVGHSRYCERESVYDNVRSSETWGYKGQTEPLNLGHTDPTYNVTKRVVGGGLRRPGAP